MSFDSLNCFIRAGKHPKAAYSSLQCTDQTWGQIQLKVFQLQIQILFKLQNTNTNTNTNFFIVFEIQIQNTSNVFQIQLQILSPRALVSCIDSLNV